MSVQIFFTFFLIVLLLCPTGASLFSTIATIGFLLPSENLTDINTRVNLGKLLQENSFPTTPIRLRVNPVYTNNTSLVSVIKNVFCSKPAQGTNALFILVDKAVQGPDGARVAYFVSAIASKAGIPTMIWNNQANELEDVAFENQKYHVSLAPPTRNQAKAIFSFFKASNLRKFSIVTSTMTPGHHHFIEALSDAANDEDSEYFRFSYDSHEEHRSSYIEKIVKITTDDKLMIRKELMEVRDNSENKIIVLFTSEEMANVILDVARMLGMTSGEYLWVCGKPVIGNSDGSRPTPANLVPGTIAVTYNSSVDTQREVMKTAIQLWTQAIKRYSSTLSSLTNNTLFPAMDCDAISMKTWKFGDNFFK